MNHEHILKLLQACNDIVQTKTCDKSFEESITKFADILLSTSSSDPNYIEIDDNFQALILLLSKLVIVSSEVLNESIYHQIFRSIIAFNLHFFSVSRNGFSKFISDWPNSFSSNYITSVLSNFFPKINTNNPEIAEISIMTLLIYLYFSDDIANNPFIKNIQSINEKLIPDIFNVIRNSLMSDVTIIMLYALTVSCKDFKLYCINSDDIEWTEKLIDPILKSENFDLIEIRLDILLIFTEDLHFSNTLSNKKINDLCISHIIIQNLLLFIKHILANGIQPKNEQVVITALTIMLNIGQKLDHFDAFSADILFSLLNHTYKKINSDQKYVKYVKYLLLFIESVCIHRASWNVELVYTTLRYFTMIQQISLSLRQIGDDIESQIDDEHINNINRSISNIEKMCVLISQDVLEKNKGVSDYRLMLKYISDYIDSWSPGEIFQITPYPTYEYVLNDLSRSLKFFRVLTLKLVQSML